MDVHNATPGGKAPYDGSDCPLCGGVGELSITPYGAPESEAGTYGCPICIAGERDDEIDELQAKYGQLVEALKLSTENAGKLVFQRDQLLGALEQLTEAVEHTPLGVRGIKGVEHARATIAALKGGAV